MNMNLSLWHNSCRIAGAWPLPSPQPPELLMEACESDLPSPISRLALKFGFDVQAIENLSEGSYVGEESWEMLMQEMGNRGISGWIVTAETPVISESGSFSWNRYTSKNFYAEDLEVALALANDWAVNTGSK